MECIFREPQNERRMGAQGPRTIENSPCATAATAHCPQRDSTSGNRKGVTLKYDHLIAFGNSLATLANGHETKVQVYSKEQRNQSILGEIDKWESCQNNCHQNAST